MTPARRSLLGNDLVEVAEESLVARGKMRDRFKFCRFEGLSSRHLDTLAYGMAANRAASQTP